MKDIRYPIGPFHPTKEANDSDVNKWIDSISILPKKLKQAVDTLNDEQLDTSYRDGGWTLRQVVHHIADSHMNGYIRVKLTLTEDQPAIKPYDQESWAELPDSMLPVEPSLELIDGLHKRWTSLLKSLDQEQRNRTCIHPEDGMLVLKNLIELYAWHGRHHLAHITTVKEQKGWD